MLGVLQTACRVYDYRYTHCSGELDGQAKGQPKHVDRYNPLTGEFEDAPRPRR